MHTELQPNNEQLAGLIVDRLSAEAKSLTKIFEDSARSVGVRHLVIDDLLPRDVAESIAQHFPEPGKMRLMESFRESKYTSKNFDGFHPLMKAIAFAFQDPRVVSLIGEITGIKQQVPDPSLYAGGLSAMTQGHFLGVHIDNSHEGSRQYYRTLNLLYYISPDWRPEFGGHLQLWSPDVSSEVTITSKYNRLVIMETHPLSWHSVSKVKVDDVRRCVSNYYFSPVSPTGSDYFNVTSFSAPPSEPVRRLVLKLDATLRQVVRFFVPDGLGRKDVYQGGGAAKR
jgi:Rps23 Pro-64 3,4-dihydroxylase Tpa1-like proline 4-hydroxylase